MDSNTVNQLYFVTVSGRQSDDLMRKLREAGFYFTQIDSSGSPLQEPTVCLLIGLNQSQTERLMAVIRKACRRRQEYVPVQITPIAGLPPVPMIEAQIGGALVCGVEVERFIQI